MDSPMSREPYPMSWGRVGTLELVVGGRGVALLGCTSRRSRTG